MGLGRFGGGAGAARWLASQGARVLVTDVQPMAKLTEPLADIADLIAAGSVTVRLGEHQSSDFTSSDLVIANPAVPKPWTNKYLIAARAAEVPITTEIRLLTEHINRDRVIGVTGSAGKSTTAAMIHHILASAGVRAHLGGNIGGSLLNQLPDIHSDDWIILELSSAMLYWLGTDVGYDGAQGWSPGIGVLTNVSPNHIDWHESFEHYRHSKYNLFRYQQSNYCRFDNGELLYKSEPVALAIPGAHNQVNAQLAVAVAEVAGIRRDRAAPTLLSFSGLPHRLQLVLQRDGMSFYNDSKSTTPEAAVLAVQAFDNPSRIHLIAGGYDKGSDLAPISSLASQIAGLYTIGKTGRRLVDAAPHATSAEHCETLESAVERAMARMHPGDILLLSPGCASWDQFINYEQRGEAFINLVNARSTARQPARAV